MSGEEYFFYVDEVSIQRTYFTVQAESLEEAEEKANKSTPASRGVMRSWSNLFEDGSPGAWSGQPGFRGHSYFKAPVFIRKMVSTYRKLKDNADRIAEHYGISKGRYSVFLTPEGYRTEFSPSDLQRMLNHLGANIDLNEILEINYEK